MDIFIYRKGVSPLKHTIQLPFDQLPLIRNADYCCAAEPFVHQNRLLDYHVLVFMVRGSISIFEDAVEYRLCPGDLLFLKSGVHHWGMEESLPNTKWYYIHFSLPAPAWSNHAYDSYTSYLKRQEFLPADHARYLTLPKVLALKPDSAPSHKFEALVTLFNSSNPLRAPYLNLRLMELLLDLASFAPENRSPDLVEVQIQRIIRYLEDHLDRPFSAAEITTYMEMSYNYLCGVFKQRTGMTMHQYHTRIRINEAARLLRETTLNVSQVSYRLGYQDPLYFSNVFKKALGTSPTDYLKQSFQSLAVRQPID